MADEKLRIGIIGASVNSTWAQRTHVPAVKALPEYELTAVCTAHEETAKESAEKFGARLAFHDYRQMVVSPEIDVVAVVVRVPNHYELTMEALKAGKHVYTEWPLAANLEEAQALAELARSKGVHTMVGLQARAAPTLLHLKALVEEGYVGEVLSCHMVQIGGGNAAERPSSQTWRADRRAGANTMTIAFGHAIDIFCHELGEFAELSAVVSTQVNQWYEPDTKRTVDVSAPDNVLVSGRLRGGAVASVHVASVPQHASGYQLEVYGREGTLALSAPGGPNAGTMKLMGGKKDEKELQELQVPEHLTWVPDDTPKGGPFNVAQMYRRFAEGIRSGQRVEPDFDTGVRLHSLLDAIQRASEEGQRQVLA